MESILSIPVISDLLLPYLRVQDIKSCRQVSRAFSSVTTPALGRRTLFTFPMLTGPAFDLDPDLVRNLRVWTECGVEWVEASTKIPDFLRNHGPTLESLEIITSSAFASYYTHILKTTDFPNLASILIHEIQPRPRERSIPYDASLLQPPFSRLPSLSRIVYSEYDPRAKADRVEAAFRPLIQFLIHAEASHLGGLRIRGNFFPDLGGCRALKSLGSIIFRWETRGGRPFNIDMSPISRMLDQVRGTLEYLELGHVPDGLLTAVSPRPILPRSSPFPCLKGLKVEGVDVFKILPSFNPTILPKLDKVSLGSNYTHESIDDFLSSLYSSKPRTVMGGVTELELYGMWTLYSFAQASTIFPNVKKLKIHTRGREPWRWQQEVGSLFRSVGGWKRVEDLEIDVRFECHFHTILRALPSLRLTGLKRIKIRKSKGEMEDLEEGVCFGPLGKKKKVALLGTRMLKSLDFFGFELFDPQGFEEFAKKNNLPVYLHQD